MNSRTYRDDEIGNAHLGLGNPLRWGIIALLKIGGLIVTVTVVVKLLLCSGILVPLYE